MAAPSSPVSATDSSLRVHSCHSPLREVEVLYDHLLDWFERDPTLAPRDVLVMTPDIEAYAPFIQAVFDSPEESEQADSVQRGRPRHPLRPARSSQAFLSLLSLPATRLEATSVLRILEAEPVRAKFGLAESDLDIIRGWVRETNIRWGQDAQQRESLGLPGLAENTWQQGMDRLLRGLRHGGQRASRCSARCCRSMMWRAAARRCSAIWRSICKRLFELVAQLGERRSIGRVGGGPADAAGDLLPAGRKAGSGAAADPLDAARAGRARRRRPVARSRWTWR